MAFASPAALVFVICWFTCGVALMLRRRQPTVAAQHPRSASFDAAHPLISLFCFHFSRRERAATQAATSARNAPPAPKTKKKRALPLRAVVCVVPRPVVRNHGHFGLRSAEYNCVYVGQLHDFWFCVWRSPRVATADAKNRSIDVDFHQPKPAQPHPRSVPHTGGAIERRRGAQRPAGARRANGPL